MSQGSFLPILLSVPSLHCPAYARTNSVCIRKIRKYHSEYQSLGSYTWHKRMPPLLGALYKLEVI